MVTDEQLQVYISPELPLGIGRDQHSGHVRNGHGNLEFGLTIQQNFPCVSTSWRGVERRSNVESLTHAWNRRLGPIRELVFFRLFLTVVESAPGLHTVRGCRIISLRTKHAEPVRDNQLLETTDELKAS